MNAPRVETGVIMDSFNDKLAVITGAGSGMGQGPRSSAQRGGLPRCSKRHCGRPGRGDPVDVRRGRPRGHAGHRARLRRI